MMLKPELEGGMRGAWLKTLTRRMVTYYELVRSGEDGTADPISKIFERTFEQGTFDEDLSHKDGLSWSAIRMEDCGCL